MKGNDTAPSGLNPDNISTVGQWWDNGVSHSYFSQPLTEGEDGKGWLLIDVVLIRLNTTWTPHGQFSVYGPAAPDGSRIGCVLLFCIPNTY